MIGLIVWCMIDVVHDCKDRCSYVNTAVRGKVVAEEKDMLLVDFSEYSKKQGYIGLNKVESVSKDECVEE